MRNLFLLAGMICLLTGCDGGGSSTVSGKVTLDDGSAAPRGAVMIRNEAGSFRDAIQSDGTYTIENVPSGEYGVAVVGVTDQEATDPDAGMAYDDETGEYLDSEVESPESLINVKYSNPQKSGLTISVPGGDYDLTVERADGAGGD